METPKKIEKEALECYYYNELWQDFTHIVVDSDVNLLAAFNNEYDANEYMKKFNEELYVVELDFEELN